MASETRVRGKLEPPGIHVGGVLLAACASLVLVGAAVAGLDAVYRAYVPSPAPPPPRTFPEPRVRVDEAGQLRRLRAEQQARLTVYAWVDRDKGSVAIPIERAIQLIVQKGTHAYDPLEPAAHALSAPGAGAQRALTDGQGPPGGPVSAPATSNAAPSADQDRETKP